MRAPGRCIRFHVLVAAAFGALAMLAAAAPARAAESYSEDAIKAAYLYRFCGYVEWPDEGRDAPLTIAVLGAPAVARELERLLPLHPIDGHTAQVRQITGAGDLGSAQILYAGRGHAALARALLRASGQRAVLFVSDEEDGLDSGSAVNFLLIDRRVRFEVSMTAAERSGIRISAELLGVAVRVQGGGRQSRECCEPIEMPASIDDPQTVRVVRGDPARRLPAWRLG